jgi:two-component system sensor kinase FixL
VSVYGVITIEENGIIETVNPAAERLFGYSAAELVGRNISMLMPDPYKREHGTYLENYRRTGVPKIIGIGREVIGLRKDGSQFPMDLAVAEFRIGGKRYFKGLVNDVTARKKAEQELIEHRDNLQQLVKYRTQEVLRAEKVLSRNQRLAAVGTLASGLAHDLNNILFAFSGRLDRVLTDSRLTGETRTDLTVVVALVEHLRAMSQNLSLFARDPDQEGIEGCTKLSSWLQSVKGLIEASLKPGPGKPNYSIALEWDLPEGLASVNMAPHRLTQVVLNLVHNARDAILVKAGSNLGNWPIGRIVVQARAEPNGGMLTLKVIDDGCGMNQEIKRRSVEPFFTTRDRPNAAGGVGSGMGLSFAIATIARVGGHFDIDSESGKGTTVTITLPTASELVEAVATA